MTRGVVVELKLGEVLEDDALLVGIELFEQVTEISADVVGENEFPVSAGACFLGGGLEDLDDGEGSEQLVVIFEVFEDLTADFVAVSVEETEIVVEVDKVSEIEALVFEELLNFGIEFFLSFSGDEMRDFGDSEFSHPE